MLNVDEQGAPIGCGRDTRYLTAYWASQKAPDFPRGRISREQLIIPEILELNILVRKRGAYSESRKKPVSKSFR